MRPQEHPTSQPTLGRLNISGERGTWRVWQHLAGARGRRVEFLKIVQAYSGGSDEGLSKMRALIDLGLYNDGNYRQDEFRNQLAEHAIPLISIFRDTYLTHLLLEAGANPNYHRDSSYGETMLTVAVSAGAAHLLEMLVKAGADLEAADENGLTPLKTAIWKTASPGSNKAGYACLVELLRLGASPNPKGMRQGGGSTDEPPVITACKANSLKIKPTLDCLIRAGASVDDTCENGFTPLHTLISRLGTEDAFRCLVENKANVNSRDKDGVTVLSRAIVEHDMKKALILLKAGADPSLRSDLGNDMKQATALHQIISIGINYDTIDEMLDIISGHEGCLEWKDGHGRTALDLGREIQQATPTTSREKWIARLELGLFEQDTGPALSIGRRGLRI